MMKLFGSILDPEVDYPDCDDDNFLVYIAVLSRWKRPAFQKCVLPPSPGWFIAHRAISQKSDIFMLAALKVSEQWSLFLMWHCSLVAWKGSNINVPSNNDCQGVGGRMGSEWILGRLAWGVWIGFDYLRTGTGGGLLWMRWWTFGFLRHGIS
jgi:hypothetical protein